MRQNWTEAYLAHAIRWACYEVDDLAEEMAEAFDAMPDFFQEYHYRRESAADRLREAAATLATLSAPDGFSQRLVEWMEMVPGKDGKIFRPQRRDNVVRCLEACVQLLAHSTDDNNGVLELNDDLQEIIDLLAPIEFPGMAT